MERVKLNENAHAVKSDNRWCFYITLGNTYYSQEIPVSREDEETLKWILRVMQSNMEAINKAAYSLGQSHAKSKMREALGL